MIQDPMTWCKQNIDRLGSYFLKHNQLWRVVPIWKYCSLINCSHVYH